MAAGTIAPGKLDLEEYLEMNKGDGFLDIMEECQPPQAVKRKSGVIQTINYHLRKRMVKHEH